MPQKMRQVIHSHFFAVHKIKLVVLAIVLASLFMGIHYPSNTFATSCPDVKVLFVRGSGATRYDNEDYQSFKSSLESKLDLTSLTYEFDDIDYPAVGVGPGHWGTTIGAFISGGESYEFGDSVKEGMRNFYKAVSSGTCSNTKYVFAGYSQGAVVILNTIKDIDPSRVIYIATFGDPKIFLPEGAGLIPAACKGENLSDYRIYVPDCRAYEGILGGRDPYVIESYKNKIGTWCNKGDILCSSSFSISDHVGYVSEGLYEDASRHIFNFIVKSFGLENHYVSPHDTAILIDSTGSMTNLITQYKEEAKRLADKTFSSGGRVALYDYRDLADGYTPVERCSFETCTPESFEEALNEIHTDGGGDTPESLLSASFQVMKEQKWNFGSTKSLVILTDADYHSPDLDGTTFYDVEKLSKQIDPVNFYIVTSEDPSVYQPLADATGGQVVSSTSDLGLLTDDIIGRYDSLPRVEEEYDGYNEIAPTLEITSITNINGTATINFEASGIYTMVVLNDAPLGLTDLKTITITELDYSRENVLSLIPLTHSIKGERVTVTLAEGEGKGSSEEKAIFIPKVPNTGRQ